MVVMQVEEEMAVAHGVAQVVDLVQLVSEVDTVVVVMQLAAKHLVKHVDAEE